MANDLTMDFGFSGNGGEYRGTGWSEPENFGIWMLGQQSLLVLTRPEASGDYRIEFDMGVLTGPGHPSQRFAVSVNGTTVGDFVLSDDSREHCTLPWSVIGREPGLTLVLSHPDAWRPSELSGGEGDQREMSFFLRSARLSLHAAAPRPPVPAASATTVPAAAAPARPVAAAPTPAAPKPVAVAPAAPKPMAPTPAPAAAKGPAPASAAPKAAPTPAASVSAAPRPSTPVPSAAPAPAPRPPVAQPPARVPAPAAPPASATPPMPAAPPRPAVRVATPEPQPAAPAPEARVPWWKKLLG